MKNFQAKKKFSHRLYSKPVLILLGIFILFFAYSVTTFALKAGETVKNKNIAQEKINELNQEKIKLSADIEKLETDAGKEASIREKFGLAKEGEGLIVVIDDTSSTNPSTQNTGFFGFIKNLFK